MTTEQSFLEYSANKLAQHVERISECLGRLSGEEVWARASDNENAVGNLVLHLCGNVRQWIGTGVAGNPDVRERDREFAARGNVTPAELRTRLQEVVGEAAAVIRGLEPRRLQDRTVIQGYDVTLLEAIYHVVEHFSGHAGQIIFATKLLTGADLSFYRHLQRPGHGEQVP
jgi:uncharacterized damage-inducible protein DinB